MTSIDFGLDEVMSDKFIRKSGGYTGLINKEIDRLADNLPITIFRFSCELSWDLDYISKGVEKLTGYPKMDFISRKLSWFDIILPEDIQIREKVVEESIKANTPYQVEYRIKRSDGSTLFVQERAHQVNDRNGNLAYIDGVFLDIIPQIKRRVGP